MNVNEMRDEDVIEAIALRLGWHIFESCDVTYTIRTRGFVYHHRDPLRCLLLALDGTTDSPWRRIA